MRRSTAGDLLNLLAQVLQAFEHPVDVGLLRAGADLCL